MFLASTRFSNETWYENKQYRRKINHKGCLYGSPCEIRQIPYDFITYVIEMNNSLNKIEGIGIVNNRPLLHKYYHIHNDQNYNRYVYKGNYRLDREQIYSLSPKLVESIEYILFREKNHMKRSTGFTIVTQKYIKNKNHEKINKLKLEVILKAVHLCFIKYFKSNS